MSSCFVPGTMLSEGDIKLSDNGMLDTANSILIFFIPFFPSKRIPGLVKVLMCLTKTFVCLDFLAARDDPVT